MEMYESNLLGGYPFITPEERLRKIVEVEEEIRLVDIEYEATFDSHTINNAWLRISARLQAALVELKRGMKGNK